MEPLQKNERFTLSKIVSEQLKQYIAEHRLKPGDKLPSERDMVKQLGISRSALREALRYLEMSGIVAIRHGEGAYVQEQDLSPLMEQLVFLWKMNAPQLGELKELRLMLELNAVELAIRNRTSEDDEILKQLAVDLLAHPAGSDKHSELVARFHHALLQATHHRPFIQMADPVVNLCIDLHRDGPVDPAHAPGANTHLQMVEAIRIRNEPLAKDLLRALLQP